MKENQNSLLIRAKFLFPPGTKYCGLLSGKLQKKIETIQHYEILRFYDGDTNIGIDGHCSYIYNRGQWAQIITNKKKIHEVW